MSKLILISGPCIIESKELCLHVAKTVKVICDRLDIDYIFKASYEKANRTSMNSFTGLGAENGLKILSEIREEVGVPVLTDIHESGDAAMVAEYVDVLQIPAFLCRQTSLLLSAGQTGKTINIKKGQFLSAEAMKFALEKVQSTGNQNVWLTERGSCWGPNNLVVDFTGLPTMQKFGAPVILDCTHSLQMPNQTTGVTGGNPSMIETMCKAAVAVGVDGLFIETHPSPAKALSDSATQLQLDQIESILEKCARIRGVL